MATVIDTVGRSPHIAQDTTRQWVESIRTAQIVDGLDGELRPSVFLRYATDTNYIRNAKRDLYNAPYNRSVNTQAMMNIALPGQRVNNLLNWSVTESSEQVTQTATMELLNCHLISKNPATTLTTALPKAHHDSHISATWGADELGVVRQLTGLTTGKDGNDNINKWGWQEDGVKYRTYFNQYFTVANASGWPSPRIPDDDDNDVPDSNWLIGDQYASGSYFLLIDDEVVRVVERFGNNFQIPPGGRAINGVLQAHAIGASVRLLNFNPTKEWVGAGYLNTDDFKPQRSLLRPGTCFVSYEGYGDITPPLTHDFSVSRNYCFTGYWFIVGSEPSFGVDGMPRVRVDLQNAGYMFESQKINVDTIQRMKNKFGQWNLGKRNNIALWGANTHDRSIPSHWRDYNEWDPLQKDSYPLKVKTEFAQHKEFFDHMRETRMGLDCIVCMQERKEWLKTHENPDALKTLYDAASGATKTALGERIADLNLKQGRAIGRHIYKQSIRVLQDEAGPVKTYIRLMGAMAAAAWDHPAYGTELSQAFSKIPNQLFDNIRNISTGLVYNGQLDFDLESKDHNFQDDYWYKGYDDTRIISMRRELTCPFESTYDNVPFSQPMIDLAEANGNQFWVSRDGYPVFVPRTFNFRPSGQGYKDYVSKIIRYVDPPNNGEWFMSYGASIKDYSHSLNATQVVTQAWTTATTAFESTFTIASAGTGYTDNGRLLFYSPFSGNKDGLALTSGVQQTTTISLDNQVLGLDWNTNAANWGVKQEVSSGNQVLNALPPRYHGGYTLDPADKHLGKHKGAIERVQRTVNFFLIRRYLPPIFVSGKWWYTIPEDGLYKSITTQAVQELQQFLLIPANLAVVDRPAGGLVRNDGVYDRRTYLWTEAYLKNNKNYIKADVWWYVSNGREWAEYVAAMTGVVVPMKHAPNAVAAAARTNQKSIETPQWVIDEKGLQKEVAKWHKNFHQQTMNVGNKAVDDSINKATVRSLSSDLADPRIQPGDTIWCEIPGFLGRRDPENRDKPPYTNGIYVNQISRQFDLTSGAYTATYSGYRKRGDFGTGVSKGINSGYDFVT